MPRTPSRLLVAIATTLAVLTGGPTAGAGPAETLPAALLVAEDLPTGFVAQGVKDATDFDIDQARFDANGGLGKVDQTWAASAMDTSLHVAIVFDFRMLFPDAAAAQAYLDAAEPILSETVSGITLQADPPVIGDATRLYAGQLKSGDVTVDVQNLLFRVGPVVAKVYVGGFGTTTADAVPIARAAASHIETWLALAMASAGPASPSASAAPPGMSAAPGVSAPPAGTNLHQWASSAAASSEYGPDDWSAKEATGAPNVGRYQDDGHAWAPHQADGTTDWIELDYPVAVQPTAVNITESFGSGAVTLVEAFDPASGSWVELWSGKDPSPADTISTFSPPVAAVTFATDRLRVTLGDVIPGWSEIDAVELVGTVP
jgi:hypothetical protein